MNLRDCIVSGLGLVKEQAKAAMVSTVSLAKQADLRKLTEVNTNSGAVGAATLVVGGVMGAVGYFLWPAAAAPAVAAATMKAPGAAGFLNSRAAFLANPQLYFQILHKAGAAAAAAAFAAL